MNLLQMIKAIAERSDTSPKEGIRKYGDVTYADEKNKKYPLDTEAHVRAALSYWGMPKNRGKYSSADQKTIGGKIRAAAKRHGIELSSNGGHNGRAQDHAESMLAISASDVAIELGADGEPPNVIAFMPPGKQRIQPLINGKPAETEIEVEVDSTLVAKLQSDLDARLAKAPRPVADFDHVQRGPASFLPKKFEWRDTEGVVLHVDWTDAGKSAVKGRNYSYFSPTFMISPEGKILGLPKNGAIGGLTNSPAFSSIKRIAAARVDPDDDYGIDPDDNMQNPIVTQCVALGLIQDSDDLEVAATQLATTVTALQARVEGAEAQLADYRAREADAKKALAVEAVDAAISEGRLPGKNIEIRTFWVNAMSANPEGTKKAIAALLPNPALKTVITVRHGDTKRSSMAEGMNVAEQIQLKVNAMRAKNPTLSIEDCYGLAEAENPELFAGATQTYSTEES
jgi:phage I-like protein